MTSIKYDHLQVMGTITGKFHQNPLKTVGGCGDKIVSTDGRKRAISLVKISRA